LILVTIKKNVLFFRLDATRDTRLSLFRSKPNSWNLHVYENPGNKKARLGYVRIRIG
jgi:hypothetical protein